MKTRTGRPLLIHSHPGHELRLFHWMEQHKPTLFLMTDGSAGGDSRTQYSARCANDVGAEPGAVFGLVPDPVWYQAILKHDLSLFNKVTDALVATAVAQDATLVVSDAVDGYNPMHDLCEAVAAAAVGKLRKINRGVTHLVARATAGGEGDAVVDLHLREDDLGRKRAAVEAYTPLAEEARRLIAEDPDALMYERLRRPAFTWPERWTPAWEKIGGERVSARRYSRPIEYAAHVRPIARALLDAHANDATAHAERNDCVS